MTIIEIQGCDDCTVVKLDLTDTELETVRKLAEASQKESTYNCMPKIRLRDHSEHCLKCKRYKVGSWLDGHMLNCDKVDYDDWVCEKRGKTMKELFWEEYYEKHIRISIRSN